MKNKKKQKQNPLIKAGYLDDCLKRLELVVNYLHFELKRARHQTSISQNTARSNVDDDLAREANVERAIVRLKSWCDESQQPSKIQKRKKRSKR